MYALSAATGHVRWTRNLASEIDGPVAVSAGQAYVYAAGLDGMVYGLSSTSGKVVWQVQAGGGIFSGGPAVKYGIVYVAQGRSGAEGGGFQTVAMQATDGLILWRSDSGDDVHVTPSVGGDATYLGAIDGTLTSLDAHTGALRWIADLGAETWSSAALANGVVFIDTESRFYALRASTGAVLYRLLDADQLRGHVVTVGGIRTRLHRESGWRGDRLRAEVSAPTPEGPEGSNPCLRGRR